MYELPWENIGTKALFLTQMKSLSRQHFSANMKTVYLAACRSKLLSMSTAAYPCDKEVHFSIPLETYGNHTHL